jgi:tetratricopeptide (TPR) repeat protein
VQYRWSILAVAPLVLALALDARAEGAPSASASASASASPAQTVLPELPRLASISLPEPDAASIKELDGLLDRLTSEDERSRTNARAAIAEVSAGLVPAIRHRVQDLRGSLDREAAPRVLEGARKAGRKSIKGKSEGEGEPDGGKKKKKAKKDEDEAADGDWLDFLLAQPHAKDRDWKDIVSLVAMERMLTAIGTTPAVRELINLHSYFGEMLRVDLQRQIMKLRDKAVPALIEARQHDAKIVQRWANKQLDVLGRAIPGEAVASNDTQILADVLRAYGRTRDVDAERVILSFSNSDRIQLREASREAIAAVGEPGIWQLRDQYLSLTGNKAPKEWAWDRLARELFALYDRARLAEVYKLMDDGTAAASAGKIVEAVDCFDKVLARSPLFDRRKEMVKSYFERATQLEEGHRDDALSMMRKALRLDPKGELAKKLEAEIAYLEGAISVDRGAPDKTAFQKALTIDPQHAASRQALAALEDKVVERQSQMPRYAAAGGIGLVALIAMILLARRKPKAAKQPEAPPPPPPEAPLPPPPEAPLPPPESPAEAPDAGAA